MILVLDTTALSAAMRLEPEMVRFLESHRPGEIASVPTVEAEIEYGISRLPSDSKKRALLAAQKEKIFSEIRILPWTSEASRAFGRIKASLEAAGTPIDDFDVAAAAIASSHGAGVITANLVHFRRIEGLESRHWTS